MDSSGRAFDQGAELSPVPPGKGGGRPATPVRRKWFRGILAAFQVGCLLVAAGLALELHQRWKNHAAEGRNRLIDSRIRRSLVMAGAADAALWREDAHRYRPLASLSLEIDGEPIEVSINEHGLRGGPVAVPKPPGCFRILCLGASTTVEGPTNDSTYPALLERKLRAQFPDAHIEVVNGGVSGVRSVDEVALLEELLHLQPDLVIEYNAVNDLYHEVIPEYQARAPLWKKALRRSQFLALNCEAVIRPAGRVVEETWQRRIFDNLAEIHRLAVHSGADVLFCSFCRPDLHRVTPEQREYLEYDLRTYWSAPYTSIDEYCRLVDEYNLRLRDWCRQRGINYAPVAETVDIDPSQFVDICHMRPPAIEAKADAVFLRVREIIESRPSASGRK